MRKHRPAEVTPWTAHDGEALASQMVLTVEEGLSSWFAAGRTRAGDRRLAHEPFLEKTRLFARPQRLRR